MLTINYLKTYYIYKTMWASLTYYIAMGSCFLMTTVGVTYYFYPYWVMDLGMHVSWKVLQTYHSVKDIIFETPTTPKTSEWKDEVDVIVYNIQENKEEEKVTIYRSPLKDIAFLKKKIDNQTFCRRLTDDVDLESISFNIIKKPLIQVELQQNNTSVEIHDELKYFYLEDNEILDLLFLQWYIKYWFDIELAEDYKLQIIDSNVNIFTLNKQQSLLFREDGYAILTKKEE